MLKIKLKLLKLKEIIRKNINLTHFFLIVFLLIQSIWITKNHIPTALQVLINNGEQVIYKSSFLKIINYPLKFLFLLFPFLSVTIIEIFRNLNSNNSILRNTSLYKLRKSYGWKFADIWYFSLSIIWGKVPIISVLGTLGVAHYYNLYSDFVNIKINNLLPFPFIDNHLFIIFIFSILLGDCVSYWTHRFSHKYFWELHEFHHSATEMTMFSFYRNGLLETFTVEAPILPFRILSIILVSKGLSEGDWSIYTLYIIYNIVLQMFIHLGHGSTKIIFPKPLSYIFLSPGLHWLHHSNNPSHFESNFGTIFPFWDRLFGTYLGEKHLQDIKGYGDPKSEYNKYHPLVCYFVIPFRKLYKKYTLYNS